MMMFYRRMASPKHRYSIIEVDYGGGGHRTWLKDQMINCCVSRVTLPRYIKEQGGCGRPRGEARREDSYSYYLEGGGDPTPGGSMTPPRAHHREGRPSPSSTSLYTGRGAPLGDTTIDH